MSTFLDNLATGLRFIALIAVMFSAFYWLFYPAQEAVTSLTIGVILMAISFFIGTAAKVIKYMKE